MSESGVGGGLRGGREEVLFFIYSFIFFSLFLTEADSELTCCWKVLVAAEVRLTLASAN